ncbi:hypothetical protein [Haloplanus pelagicus]|jgi:hypothetical protein|uniref:hypothetical protein n=1 Tax=Haloplanus pelagicus TaxID=2949995 RepID=UPI00203BA743|nr:hypothetical protein [Haloplanus sp. HW8-1]
MVDDRVGRRAMLGAGVGLLASLSGCSRLFIEPETTTPTPDGGEPSTPSTATPTPEPTDRPEPTARPTPTAVSLPNDRIDVTNRRFAIRRSRLETFALVTYRFDVENVGDRTIRDVEFRVDLRYEHEDIARIVGTDYHRFVFDPPDETDGEGSDETREGLQSDEIDRARESLRFERDGRAQNSTAAERFDLELAVRRIRYL